MVDTCYTSILKPNLPKALAFSSIILHLGYVSLDMFTVQGQQQQGASARFRSVCSTSKTTAGRVDIAVHVRLAGLLRSALMLMMMVSWSSGDERCHHRIDGDSIHATLGWVVLPQASGDVDDAVGVTCYLASIVQSWPCLS